jgi:hypothetical protein
MVADREYIAIFPNKQILETFSRSSGFELALHKIVITVSPTNINPVVSSKLQEGWVIMYNVSDEAKSMDAATAIAELAGEVVVADEVSLIKVGPIRVKIRERDIEKVRGFVEVFIEGEWVCKESDARSLIGGGGELGNLKNLNLWLRYFLHKGKLEHTI